MAPFDESDDRPPKRLSDSEAFVHGFPGSLGEMRYIEIPTGRKAPLQSYCPSQEESTWVPRPDGRSHLRGAISSALGSSAKAAHCSWEGICMGAPPREEFTSWGALAREFLPPREHSPLPVGSDALVARSGTPKDQHGRSTPPGSCTSWGALPLGVGERRASCAYLPGLSVWMHHPTRDMHLLGSISISPWFRGVMHQQSMPPGEESAWVPRSTGEMHLLGSTTSWHGGRCTSCAFLPGRNLHGCLAPPGNLNILGETSLTMLVVRGDAPAAMIPPRDFSGGGICMGASPHWRVVPPGEHFPLVLGSDGPAVHVPRKGLHRCLAPPEQCSTTFWGALPPGFGE